MQAGQVNFETRFFAEPLQDKEARGPVYTPDLHLNPSENKNL